MTRKLPVLLLVLLSLIGGPALLQALTICNQYHESDGSCSTICDFYGPKGEYRGNIEYGWCN